ncbi:MAG: hypothetical protein QW579_06065 [Desulfurococcaceae archaeon]
MVLGFTNTRRVEYGDGGTRLHEHEGEVVVLSAEKTRYRERIRVLRDIHRVIEDIPLNIPKAALGTLVKYVREDCSDR